MPTEIVNGLRIAYELHGEGDPVAITPGGRYGMDVPGVRELAQGLADAGHQVLIWDRPNTGASDICFEADVESHLHADTLAGLIKTLGLGRTNILGGSAGSRVSLLTVVRHPDVVNKLAIWWITGGFFGLVGLAMAYCGQSWEAAKRHGMEGVVDLPAWQDTLQKNPDNRERLLGMDAEEFAERMEVWGPTFLAPPDSPVPGLQAGDFAAIDAPTLVFRNGSTDLHHPRRTSEWVHALIPHSELVEPPWGDSESNERREERERTGVNVIFKNWPRLAPQLVEFLSER